MNLITIDQDFAKESAIKERIFSVLEKYNCKATVFVTNPFTNMAYENIEFGIHPNFINFDPYPTPTLKRLKWIVKRVVKRKYFSEIEKDRHGNTIQEVFNHCFKLVPNAVSMRSHYLHVSQLIYREAGKRGIRYDSSTFTYYKYIVPFNYQYCQADMKINIIRYPYLWEDGYVPDLDPRFSLSKQLEEEGRTNSEVVYIWNFHPVNIFTMSGIGDFFDYLVKQNCSNALTVRELENYGKQGSLNC